VDGAITVLTRLEQLDDSLPADAAAGLNSAKDVFAVAIDVLKARIADADKQPDTAVKLLRDAVTREDKLSYDEPSDWFFPVRHLLGAQLLKAGKPADAEAVYREDLRQHPENGWALYGLGEALKAQNKKAEAAIIQKRFQSAWKNADITLKASAF
jgi:tetratricopeptide (TPR) repeat protein